MATGLYVHVPFCTALCPYCDFAVVVGRRDVHERYCDALVVEAAARAPLAMEPADSVFVGGGTPTVLDASVLARALERIRAHVPVAPGAEITIEANPESLPGFDLAAAGVTRVSIGAQSFSDAVLAGLGRTHDAAQIARAVGAARAAGISNVSLDLIYGGPGESMEDWRRSLERAVALGVEHVSCYALTIEERTAFGKAVARGAMEAPEQDDLADRYELALDLLGEAGYRHYELSNWAKPGFESAHNLVYWTQGDYIGLGLGAHSHAAGARWWNTRALGHYLEDPANARDGEEHLDDRARAQEWLSLRLRLVEGVDLDDAERHLLRDLRRTVVVLEHSGLVVRDGARMTLTRRGMLLENEVALRLLEG